MESKSVVFLSWITLGIAVVVLVSPWIFGFASGGQMTTSLLGGIFVGAMSVLAILVHRMWAAWANLLLLNLVAGAAIFMAPLLLHYNNNNAATWIHMVGGIAIAVIAVMQVWRLAPNGSPTMAR